MGSQLSQSQELKSVFPSSQYKILDSDKSFPQINIFQKLSDSSTFALLISDHLSPQDRNFSDHVLKIIERKKIGKNNLQIYEWATTHVYGLIEYITHIDKTRPISKSQFTAILQGAIKGYSSISQQLSPHDCLHIDMKNLRIFHSISLKNDPLNRKQIVDSLNVKVVPLKIAKNLNKQQSKSSTWASIGTCIHNGGIHTEKQLLAHYLLQISDFILRSPSKDMNESLKNISNIFGSKISKVIESLLQNQSWKNVIEILDSSEISSIKQLKLQSKDELSIGTTKSKESLSTNKIETQKQISIQKVQSQKTLFKFFQKQKRQQQRSLSKVNRVNQPSQITQGMRNEKVLNEKNMNILQLKNKGNFMGEAGKNFRIIQNQPLFQRAKSPQSNKIISQTYGQKVENTQPKKPASVNLIKEIVSAEKTKPSNIDLSPRLTRAKSILTIYPDVFRDQTQNRSRILSTKIIQNQFKSPQKIQQKIGKFNSPQKCNTNKLVLKETVPQNHQIKPQMFQQRKGKPISFKPSQANPTLQPQTISVYQVKTRPDTNETCKKQQKQKANTSNIRLK